MDAFERPLVHDHTVCTDNEEGTGVCNGDYGAGLVNIDYGKLIGVSSCMVPSGHGVPDGYTRIAAYIYRMDHRDHKLAFCMNFVYLFMKS